MHHKIYITLLGLLLSLHYVHCQYRLKSGQESSLEDRVQQLTELTIKRPVIKLNSAKFKEFVLSTPRNYSFIVMFTAMTPQRQCQICRLANDEFLLVANSFRYSQAYSNKLFFATVDFDEASDIFNVMKLNTAPTYMHFPMKGKPKSTDIMDVQRLGFSAEAIAKWIATRTVVQIIVYRPINYFVAVIIPMLLVLFGVFFYPNRNNFPFICNKTIWGLGALFFTLTMISGQMWNHIRGPPFIYNLPNGNFAYIHASSQGQVVLESYIVMILNGAMVLGMILMTESALQKGDVKKRQIFVAIGIGLVWIFFSLLLSIFKNKTPGYPYTSPLKLLIWQ